MDVGVFGGVIEVSTDCGRKIGVVACGVGDEIVPPIIKNTSMRVGEVIRGVTFKRAGSRFESINRGVVISDRSPSGLDLRSVENSVTEINRSAGLKAHCISGVVGIGRGQ